MVRRAEPPGLDDLQALSVRLMAEYDERFRSSDLDLAIGRVRSFLTRGIGLEINGEWYSVAAARRPLFRCGWMTLLDLEGVEQTIRAYLEAQLRMHSSGGANR